MGAGLDRPRHPGFPDARTALALTLGFRLALTLGFRLAFKPRHLDAICRVVGGLGLLQLLFRPLKIQVGGVRLIGVFELLADSREQVRGVTSYVQALRDFWIADTALNTALTGRSPGASASSGPSSEAAAPAAAAH